MDETKTAPRYIDGADCAPKWREVGFLICETNVRTGHDHWRLALNPARTNQSHEEKLNGWCGTTDDVATYACGLARVNATVPSTGRVQVVPLTNPVDVACELQGLGYPELAP